MSDHFYDTAILIILTLKIAVIWKLLNRVNKCKQKGYAGYIDNIFAPRGCIRYGGIANSKDCAGPV